MMVGGTTPDGGATKAMFWKRWVPQPPNTGSDASRSTALILPSMRMVRLPSACVT